MKGNNRKKFRHVHTNQKYYNYINEKCFKILCMNKMCHCYVFYPLKYFIKNKTPPLPPSLLYPLSWLFPILYGNINNAIIIYYNTTHPQKDFHM